VTTVGDRSRELAIAAALAASEKKAGDIRILEVRDLIVITDYFVLATGATERQVRTICDEVEKELLALGEKPIRREGEREATWVLLDYDDLIVHVFTADVREYYSLERLWRDAPEVFWNGRASAPKAGEATGSGAGSDSSSSPGAAKRARR
jgi:ribosome-associated protein